MTIAAVTMVYNEAAFLPIWIRHYAAQIGARSCYVIDHGSSDGSTTELGDVNVVRLPRSPHDDIRRAAFIGQFCAALLGYYDGVIHTDVDEIVVADPTAHANLTAYADQCSLDAVNAVGLNVIQQAGDDAFDPNRPVLSQRHGAAFSSALCKPVLIRRPVRWSPGFHCSDAPLAFDGLFLFHLRYFDRATAAARLIRTRAMEWADPTAGAHQRVSDTAFATMLDNFALMPRQQGVQFDLDTEPLRHWIKALRDSQAGRESQPYTFDIHLNAYEIWSIPPAYQGIF